MLNNNDKRLTIRIKGILCILLLLVFNISGLTGCATGGTDDPATDANSAANMSISGKKDTADYPNELFFALYPNNLELDDLEGQLPIKCTLVGDSDYAATFVPDNVLLYGVGSDAQNYLCIIGGADRDDIFVSMVDNVEIAVYPLGKDQSTLRDEYPESEIVKCKWASATMIDGKYHYLPLNVNIYGIGEGKDFNYSIIETPRPVPDGDVPMVPIALT